MSPPHPKVTETQTQVSRAEIPGKNLIGLIESHDLSLTNHCQFSSVTQLCLTLCDPMDCSMPGLPVHHQLLELTQTHVH